MSESSFQSAPLAVGARVHVCDCTLQAFYGFYGTISQIHRCRDGQIRAIDVLMDDLPASEGCATFYPGQIRLLPEAAGGAPALPAHADPFAEPVHPALAERLRARLARLLSIGHADMLP